MYLFLECHNDNEIRQKDPIRCRECGYRIMYKKRTKRRILSVILNISKCNVIMSLRIIFLNYASSRCV